MLTNKLALNLYLSILAAAAARRAPVGRGQPGLTMIDSPAGVGSQEASASASVSQLFLAPEECEEAAAALAKVNHFFVAVPLSSELQNRAGAAKELMIAQYDLVGPEARPNRKQLLSGPTSA